MPGEYLLLRLQRGDLRGVDLSRLSIRQAYLAEVDAQVARLVDAHLTESVRVEAFSVALCLTLSEDRTLLAAGERRDGWDGEAAASPWGALLPTLTAERRYERMDIAGLSGISEAQCQALSSLGAVEGPMMGQAIPG